MMGMVIANATRVSALAAQQGLSNVHACGKISNATAQEPGRSASPRHFTHMHPNWIACCQSYSSTSITEVPFRVRVCCKPGT